MSMLSNSCAVIAAGAVVLTLSPVPVAGGEFEFVEIRVVEGTDPAHEASVVRKLETAGGNRGVEPADIEKARAEREAMKSRGYIVAGPEVVDLHRQTVTSGRQLPVATFPHQLGFRPAAFSLGLPVDGVLYEPATDGRIHDITTVMEHPSLGTISIRERSLATEPRAPMSKYIYTPKFDMDIEGTPGLLTVYRLADGSRGRTALSLLSESRLTVISVGSPVRESDASFEDILAIARRL